MRSGVFPSGRSRVAVLVTVLALACSVCAMGTGAIDPRSTTAAAITLEAADDRSLVADDGLHPSGAQYARWVERLVPVVRGLFGG